AEAEPALRPAPPGRTRLFEHGLQGPRWKPLAVAGHAHLEPAALDLARLDLHGTACVLECVADQVREHLAEVSRFAESRKQSRRQVDLDSGGPLRVTVIEHRDHPAHGR